MCSAGFRKKLIRSVEWITAPHRKSHVRFIAGAQEPRTGPR